MKLQRPFIIVYNDAVRASNPAEHAKPDTDFYFPLHTDDQLEAVKCLEGFVRNFTGTGRYNFRLIDLNKSQLNQIATRGTSSPSIDRVQLLVDICDICYNTFKEPIEHRVIEQNDPDPYHRVGQMIDICKVCSLFFKPNPPTKQQETQRQIIGSTRYGKQWFADAKAGRL